ncbi:MAG: MGMT family protein [Verrucomicrobiota bacterium]
MHLIFSESGLNRMDFGVSDGTSGSGKETGLPDDSSQALQDWLKAFVHASEDVQWAMLDLQGTDFQRSVWKELLKIPYGTTVSYGTIAAKVGRAKASRAVGSAVGANAICILVPCHRVLPASGKPGNYRWGAAIKRALLDAEQVKGSNLTSLLK